MAEIETEPPPHSQLESHTSQQWPAWYALFTSWLLSATTARRTEYVSLPRAFRVHLVAIFLGILLVTVMASWEQMTDRLSFAALFEHSFDLFGELIEEFYEEWDSPEFLLSVLGGAIAIELGFIALALLIVAWGARVEPLRASSAHALRRTWLQTGHALPAIFLVGVLAVYFDHARREWSNHHPWPSYPTYSPPSPPTQPATLQAVDDYNRAVLKYDQEQNKNYQQILQEHRSRQPWFVRYAEVFPAAIGFICGGWIIWALLRSAGVARHAPQLKYPPGCEFCGYNLTTANMQGRCSECGQPVIESLGAHVRPGSAWQQYFRTKKMRGYWRTSIDALLRPNELGRQIKLFSPGTEHRRFLAWHLIPILLISAIGFPFVIIADSGIETIRREPEIVWLGSPLIGLLTAIGALAFTLMLAGCLGVFLTFQFRRNVLPAAMQIASYLMGFLTLGILFGWLTGLLFTPPNDWSRQLQQLWHMDDEAIRFLAWFGVNFPWVVFYIVRLAQGSAAAAFANR